MGILGISRNVISYRMLHRYLLGLINKRVLHASLFYFSMNCKHPFGSIASSTFSSSWEVVRFGILNYRREKWHVHSIWGISNKYMASLCSFPTCSPCNNTWRNQFCLISLSNNKVISADRQTERQIEY